MMDVVTLEIFHADGAWEGLGGRAPASGTYRIVGDLLVAGEALGYSRAFYEKAPGKYFTVSYRADGTKGAPTEVRIAPVDATPRKHP